MFLASARYPNALSCFAIKRVNGPLIGTGFAGGSNS